MCNKSESIKNIAVALVKFNSEVKIIEKDAKNPHFKNQYASLDTIIDEVRPLLAKHGLSIMQFPGGDGENFTLRTLLLHESGEWIESEPLTMRPVKNDPQGIGSCNTYARRYSLSAMLSLNTGEEDDDGNGASQNGQGNANHGQATQHSQPSQTAATGQAGQPSDAISDGQRKMLYAKHNQSYLKGSFERISDHLGYPVTKFEEVKRSDVNKLIALLDENKAS